MSKAIIKKLKRAGLFIDEVNFNIAVPPGTVYEPELYKQLEKMQKKGFTVTQTTFKND